MFCVESQFAYFYSGFVSEMAPLHYCAQRFFDASDGNVEICRLLLESKADVHSKGPMWNKKEAYTLISIIITLCTIFWIFHLNSFGFLGKRLHSTTPLKVAALKSAGCWSNRRLMLTHRRRGYDCSAFVFIFVVNTFYLLLSPFVESLFVCFDSVFSVGKRRHSISVLKIALASCLTTLKSAGYCSPRKRMLIQEITSDTSRPHHIYSYQLFIIINNFYYHYHYCSSIVSYSSHCHRAILTGF